jgi:hypothetical protein
MRKEHSTLFGATMHDAGVLKRSDSRLCRSGRQPQRLGLVASSTIISRAAGRILRSLTRFSIAFLIGVGATLTWQSHGDKAMEMVSTWFPSLRLFSVSTTTSAPDGQGSAHDVPLRQSALVPQGEAPAAATISELPQLDPMARDVAPRCGAA